MTATGGTLSALVCEDNVLLRRAVVGVMSRCGFGSIIVVATGREAVHSASGLPPRAAVIDLALAGAEGVAVVRTVLEAAPSCTVVVLSPFAALRPSALAAGAYALCDVSDLRQLQFYVKHAVDHPMGFSACHCHGVVGTGAAGDATGQPLG